MISHPLKRLSFYIWNSSKEVDLQWRLGVAFFVLLLPKAALVSAPIILQEIIQSININSLLVPIFLIAYYGFLRFLSYLLNELREYFFADVEQESVRNLALSVFHRLSRLSLRLHLDRATGNITKSIDKGVRAVESVLRFSTFTIIPYILKFVFVSIVMFILYPPIYGIMICITLIYI